MQDSILKSMSDVLLVVNSDGIIVETNDSIEDVFLWKKTEILNQPLSVLLPDRFKVGHSSMFRAFIQNPSARRMGKGKGTKFLGKDKKGNEFYIDIGLSTYVAENGENLFVAIIRDISNIMHLGNELEKQIDDLTAKNSELDQFAYIVSHDLKAPARNINGLLEAIAEDYPEILESGAGEMFTLVKQQANSMSELIDGILQYTRAGEENGQFNNAKLFDFVKEIVGNLDIPIGFKVQYEIPDSEFVIHEIQLSQVLSNIVGNAIKYHDRNDGQLTIKCRTTIDEIEFTVSDDGPGIHKKDHAKIFEMFGTAHGQNRPDSTGIGLAIVKKIIERNGGIIKIESEIGKGTTFTFTWKIQEST